MARKNPFANLLGHEEPASDTRALDYATKGATRSLLSWIDEIAAQADKLLEGETIVELDPATIDNSFAKDRFDLDDEDYKEEFQRVLEAVRERGQNPGTGQAPPQSGWPLHVGLRPSETARCR